MVRLFIYFLILIFYSSISFAVEYDGKYYGKFKKTNKKCELQEVNLLDEIFLSIDRHIPTLGFKNSDLLYKGQFYEPKKRVGLNGKYGYLKGIFENENTINFKFQEHRNCTFTLKKSNSIAQIKTSKDGLRFIGEIKGNIPVYAEPFHCSYKLTNGQMVQTSKESDVKFFLTNNEDFYFSYNNKPSDKFEYFSIQRIKNTNDTCLNVGRIKKSDFEFINIENKSEANNNLIAKKEKKESNKKNLLVNSNSNPNIKYYAIAKYDIRIKEEDDIWSRNIGEVKKGQRIEIIDGINDIYASSYKIKHNNKIGYITKSLVQEEFGVLKNISKNNKKINYDKIFYCKEADGNVVSYKNGCYNLLEISKEEYDKQKKNKKISNKVVKKILEKPKFKKTKDVYFCVNPKNGKIAEYKYGCYGLDEISEDEYLYAKNNRRINKNNLNKNKQDKKQSIQVAEDNSPPSIIIRDKFTADENLTASIKGKIVDDSDIALITVDGYEVSLLNGEFRKDLFVKKGGRSIEIVSFDVHGNKSSKVVIIERQSISVAENIFDFLDPRKLIVDKNNNAAALIIGVESYKNTFTAPFASNDALMFSDFAQMSLGVPRNKIEILTNEDADQNNTLKTVIKWLPKVIKEDETDLYVFFSGHGLASPDGEDLFLLPFDGDPEILEFSALMRNELFNQISKLNPRSVTVFLDTCYSGATRSNEMLIASAKPIFIEAQEQNIPSNFTVFSASSNNEIATVLEEAEHGLFSYFMMKGLEGEADTNNDRTITNGELHAFINKNVSRQANQTPQLKGNPEQVLVQW